MIAGLIVVAAVAAFVKLLNPAKESASNAPAPQDPNAGATQSKSGSTDQGTAMSAEKKVSVRTQYNNPAGSDEVAFTLTVDKSGIITDAQTDILAVHGISQTRQKSFADAFPTAVKGKKLSELAPLDRVGGSSLTTGAFNAVLPQLKAEL